MNTTGWARRIGAFYLDGFRAMRLGRTLWKIVLLKILIMFAVLKPFFFPDYLKSNFASDAERAGHVVAQLVNAENIERQTVLPPVPGAERLRTGDRRPAGRDSDTTRR